MRFATVFLPVLAALGVTASPIPDPSAAAPYTWSVTNFGLGCSPGGCSDGFQISGAAHAGQPAFSAACSATSYDKDFVACQGNKHVSQYFTFPAKPNSNVDFYLHIRYKAAGKTFAILRPMKYPPYQQTINFKVFPKQVQQ